MPRATTSTQAKSPARKRSAAASVSHDDAVARELREDPALAAAYLKAALAESDEPKVLLIALRQLAKAHGIARIAKEAQIERESLYRALSAKGNPRFSTIVAVVHALGLVLTVQPAGPNRHRRVRVTRLRTKTSTARANKPRTSRAA
jgi:probable addiction module antidote protein